MVRVVVVVAQSHGIYKVLSRRNWGVTQGGVVELEAVLADLGSNIETKTRNGKSKQSL